MKVIVLHNPVSPDAAPDERDVLVQIEAVSAALRELGHQPLIVPFPENPFRLDEMIDQEKPQAIFNLVEDVGGDESLAYLVPQGLEHRVPVTGVDSAGLGLLGNKVRAKERMLDAALPTPRWLDPFGYPSTPPGGRVRLPARVIIKSARAHASKGIDDQAVVFANSLAEVKGLIRSRLAGPDDHVYAEEFIDGREFNLSLIADPADPTGAGCGVLPAAEIEFIDFPPGKPRIVGYDAKWNDDSMESRNTRRRFDFPGADGALLDELRVLARTCWAEFNLTGYARVDFRVDAAGRPWILEVNANPCLSPDAGFAAALSRAGLAYTQGIGRILDDALRRIPVV